MAAKIKRTNQKPKISMGETGVTSCYSDQNLAFSLRYLTSNNNYNEKSFGKNAEKAKNLSLLFARLQELSEHSWLEWNQMSKKDGVETIQYSEIRFKAKQGANIAADKKMTIFRVDTHNGTKKGRIIGYKDQPCATFYIIGFDYDFSAYNHGS